MEGDGATTAIWELEIFGGRPSWKVTELQLQSGNSRLFGAGPVGRRQGHNCNLGTRDFLDGRPSWKMTGLQLQSGNSRFLVAGLVGRRQGYNCNLGIRGFFGWEAHLEGDRVTTAIWELEIFGGRPSWKVTGLQLQSGNSGFFGAGSVGRRQGYNCNLGTRDFWWQAQLESDRATTAIWDLEIFGGSPNWKATDCNLGT